MGSTELIAYVTGFRKAIRYSGFIQTEIHGVIDDINALHSVTFW